MKLESKTVSMTSSELHRKLLYCGYVDLVDYLSNSPTNRHIYNLMIDILPQHQIEVPIVTFFNEVYYQCTRVQFDGNPGDDVQHRYLDEEATWLGAQKAALLVFCLVWALIKRKKQLLFNDECFLKQLFPLIEKSEFMPLALGLYDYMKSECLVSPYQFDPKPCPVTEIPLRIHLEHRLPLTWWNKIRSFLGMKVYSAEIGYNPWRMITDGFSENTIRWYVSLYPDSDDQLQLLERIESACTKEEHQKHAQFFIGLKVQIERGNYDSTSMRYFQTYGASMYARDIMDMDEWVVKEEARKREEMQQNHELELAKMEAGYEVEIAKLKQQLTRISGNQAAADGHEPEPDSKDLVLDVAEMVAHVKDRFDETAAYQFCNMFYSLAIKHGKINDEASALMDSVIPAIHEREARHQTINIPTADQVNINPQKVVNETHG